MHKYDLLVYPNLLRATELLDESNYTKEQPLNPSTMRSISRQTIL